MNLATEERTDEVARPEPRTARLGGTDIFRGALVIITAIVIGGFVISRGLDQGSVEVTPSEDIAADDQTGQADPADSGTDDQGITTPTVPDTTIPAPADTVPQETTVAEVVPAAPVARDPAEVKVLVLNGAQTQGIAARGTEALKAGGYLTAAPKNANAQQPSVVLWAEGYELDAMAVAGVFAAGLEAIVQPLDLGNLPIDDTQGANVIVVIGPDGTIPIP